MPVVVECECGKKLRAPDDAVGRRAKCPACGSVMVIAAPEPLPVEPLPVEEIPEEPEPARASEPDPYNIVDDTDLAARTRADRERALRRQELATKAQQYGLTPQPRRSMLEPPPGATNRPYRYLLLLFTLLPLVWTTFRPEPRLTVEQRLQQTVDAHPDSADKINDLPESATEDQLFDALPGHRFEGALLSHDTYVHWGFAALSAGMFFGLILLLFPPGHTKVVHLLVVGLFTGTLGILLLLALQWAAFHLPLMRGGGWVTLIVDLIWLIGLSYRMALGDYNIFLSIIGFTAGVGFCEEACKALPLIWKARDSGFVSWRSAMLWGLVSGVGFGVSEGVTYSHDYYNGVHGGQIYLVRFISCVALHGIWAAATGINVYRRQDFFRGQLHPLEWVMQVGITVIVPMILHGLYDTLLKQEYNWLAVVVALASFGWLAWQIELAKRKLDPQEA